jgi:serine/threonine-protein phosphatase 6 regulatory ankyrin repeat subunit B
MLALKNGHRQVAGLLIRANCDVNAKRITDGFTPLILANGPTFDEKEMDTVVDLLIKKGADVNAKNAEGYNSLMAASLNGFVKSVKLLLSAGARVNEKNREGSTALRMAQDANSEIVDILKKAGAKE